jgi:hypothetical protein
MDYRGGRNVSRLIGPAAGYAVDFSHSYTVPNLLSIAGNFVAAAVTAITTWAWRDDRDRAAR